MTLKEARATPAMLSSQWPDGPSADPVGEAARRFALGLKSAIGERSVREVARGIYAAPLRVTDLGDLPRTYLDVGSSEIFRDEVIDYPLRLSEAGVVVDFHLWRGCSPQL